jgi:hypothetical protein
MGIQGSPCGKGPGTDAVGPVLRLRRDASGLGSAGDGCRETDPPLALR